MEQAEAGIDGVVEVLEDIQALAEMARNQQRWRRRGRAVVVVVVVGVVRLSLLPARAVVVAVLDYLVQLLPEQLV